MSGLVLLLAAIAVVLFFGFTSSRKRSTGQPHNTVHKQSPRNSYRQPSPSPRQPRLEDINPSKCAPTSNPLEIDVPRALDDSAVYWENDEVGYLPRGHALDDDSGHPTTTHSGIPSVLIEMPPYEPEKWSASEYRRWTDFCIKHGLNVPHRVFKEFDEGEKPTANPLDRYLD